MGREVMMLQIKLTLDVENSRTGGNRGETNGGCDANKSVWGEEALHLFQVLLLLYLESREGQTVKE